TLLPSRHHALLWPRRGAWDSLLLSRLVVRHARPLPRTAVRAGMRAQTRSRAPALVSRAGTLRADLRLYGPAGEEAGAAALRLPGNARARRVDRSRRQQHRFRRRYDRALQLASTLRKRAGCVPRPHSAWR